MTTTLSPDRLDRPPPRRSDLTDRDVVVGWVSAGQIGFRGFADETEAVHAAWMAWRTLARRLARRDGTRPVPIDSEPLALQRLEGRELILAGGRPIAALIRPGNDSPSGSSFGFEVSVPQPADELRIRSKAHLMYRTLRRSGVRWSLWNRQLDHAHDDDAGKSNVARHARR